MTARPFGYWKKKENVDREVTELTTKLGRFPKFTDFHAAQKESLYQAVTAHYGGLPQMREQFGHDETIKPMGYWKSIEHCIAATLQIMREQKLTKLPTQKQLGKLGYSGLSTAISEYHGGFRSFRTVLGQAQIRRTHGSLRNQHALLDNVRTIMQEHRLSDVPTHEWLGQHGYSSVSGAISTYHGGFRKIQELLGREPRAREAGSMSEAAQILAEVRAVMQKHKLTTMPAEKTLRKLGYSGLCGAIYKYHGGMRNIRTLLGEQQREKPKGVWKDLDYTLGQAKELLQKNNLTELPTHARIAELGYASLVMAVQRYHGGFAQFNEQLAAHRGVPAEQERLEALLDQYVHAKTKQLESFLGTYLQGSERSVGK